MDKGPPQPGSTCRSINNQRIARPARSTPAGAKHRPPIRSNSHSALTVMIAPVAPIGWQRRPSSLFEEANRQRLRTDEVGGVENLAHVAAEMNALQH